MLWHWARKVAMDTIHWSGYYLLKWILSTGWKKSADMQMRFSLSSNLMSGKAAAGQATASPKVKYPKLATRASKKSRALILTWNYKEKETRMGHGCLWNIQSWQRERARKAELSSCLLSNHLLNGGDLVCKRVQEQPVENPGSQYCNCPLPDVTT